MFSIILLNDFQSLNTFEIFVWDIFAFFASEFVDSKQALIGEISNENQIRPTWRRSEIINLHEQATPILYFYRWRIWIFFYFLGLFFFLTLDLSFYELSRKTDPPRGDFKWESNHAYILQMGNNAVIWTRTGHSLLLS